MPVRHAEDALDAANVADGVGEADQVHPLRARLHVVVFELLLHKLLQAVRVGHLLVRRFGALGRRDRHEVAELRHDAVLEEGRQLDAKGGDGAVVDNGCESRMVGLVGQAVAKDAVALVAPQPDDGVLGVVRDLLRLHHALHHPRDVAQVEGVVRFGRDGLKVAQHSQVQVDRALDDGLGQPHDVRLAVEPEMAAHDGREDALHGVRRRLRHHHHRVVPHVARRERVAAATGGAARAALDHVGHLLPKELLPVVEATLVEELPEQLNRRRGAVLLECRHVDVVDKHDHPLARRRAEQRLLALVQLRLDRLLRAARRRLGREGDGQRRPAAAIHHPVDEVGDDDRLADSRVAGEEHRLSHLERALQQVRVPQRVHRRYEHREEGSAGVVLEIGHPLLPRQELGRRQRQEVVVHVAGDGNPRVVGEKLAGEFVKGRPVLVVDGAADRPDEAEGEDVANDRLQLLSRLGQVQLGQRQQRVEEGAERAHQLRVDSRHQLAHPGAREGEAAVDGGREEAHQVVGQLLGERWRLLGLGGPERALEPRLDARPPAEALRRQIHHPAARDGGWRGHGQVLHLEQHVHLGVELDALAVGQAERHVVVEHRIHVLDPERVHRPVKDDPLVLVVLRRKRDRVADHGRGDAVGPLLRERVDLAVQLAHRDALWVEDVRVDRLEGRIAGAAAVQLRHGRGERPHAGSLAAARRPDGHHAEAHVERLVKLNHLGHKLVDHLQPGAGASLLGGRLQQTVVDRRHHQAGVQVADDAVEERQVGCQEAGHVGLAHGADQADILGQLGVAALDAARHDQHRLDLPHAVVVVVLLRELLRAELVHLDHLLRERARVQETLREEHDLGDERVVRHHHRHGPEERLQVVGQLGPACVARVHRDEDAVGRPEPNFAPLEHELVVFGQQRLPDCEQLLGHHRQHLDVDPVELVEAGPAASLCHAREELAHHLVVKLVGAVEDNALPADALGHVLDRLGLAGAGRPGRRAAQPDVQRTSQRHPAAVGQRRDDEARESALVLVAVECAGVDLPDYRVVDILLPVEAQLHRPRERVWRVDLLVDHGRDDVAVVHVAGDERHQRLALQPGELAADGARQVFELRPGPDKVGLEAGHHVARRVQHLLHLLAPVHHGHRQHHLRNVCLRPVQPLLLLVLAEPPLHLLAERLDHGLLHVAQPLLDGAAGFEVLAQPDALALLREHAADVDGRGTGPKVERLDVVEALD
mmetsp:Transcript_2367/g.7837  ORF Transcript_2367/g.7837 Transcript_2367/m.7837 type:complete len:1218 (-) Transcript_2367:3636-7289(-)